MPRIQVVRGDIVYADLRGAVGVEKLNDEASGSRPCVVVQNNAGNLVSPLTIIAPLTDARQYKGYPQQVRVSASEVVVLGAAAKDSIVECGHLRSIDRDERIHRNCGPISARAVAEINSALKASLGIE